MFGLEKISGIITARTPLHHGGNEKTGSVVMLNRMKYKTVDGSFQDIPFISGNAVRGVLRRMLIQDFFDHLDYALDVSKPNHLRLYHAFFAGGVLETVDKKSSGIIDVKLKRRIIEFFPPIRLLGFSLGNQIIPSKLKVSHMLPICKELKHILPESIKTENSFYDLLTTGFQTRKDDVHAERGEGDQAVQMLIEYELFSPGSCFFHEFMIEDPDKSDISCFGRMLELWKTKPFIGGKSSVGFGEISLNYDFNKSSKDYLEFITKERNKIKSIIDEL